MRSLISNHNVMHLTFVKDANGSKSQGGMANDLFTMEASAPSFPPFPFPHPP